ncbi:TonB-dependent receptor plug domain-containing protein [Parasphingopyxis sp. CP4]|uniref:TonB-dependent receptor plug domain-containing protein n=1 Tax=Parasphingopyxis sp. CP4 TaxID=2724527 RepID=UPI0015A130A0|nr:TonB-dependent receptor plug domain-containing protein [Parasphingopyxis sp. CP4]QLC20993.1 TonB-dependent receptor plug domain-containing protein [Parasphingopyxis sp. CP4]
MATVQDETDIGSETTARRSFVPADFAQFAPRNALDMVNQIPGFSVREGGDDRGLGQADTNVLINGRRVSGKSNGPVEALSRISAADVVRLEIVDGAGLDIGGLSGQVLNVITANSGGISGQFRVSPQFRSSGTPFRWGEAEITVSGGGENSEWTLSLANDQNRRGDAGPEFLFDGAGALLDTRQEQNNQNTDRPSISGSFSRTAANGNVLNVNGEAQLFFVRRNEVSERSGAIDVDRLRLLRETEDEFSYEIGADYEFALGGGRLKVIGLRRFENSPSVDRVDVEFADGRPMAGSVFTQEADEAETILRSEYAFAALGGNWQFSLEGARNSLDIEADLEQRDADGDLQPVDFLGSSSRVEEDRGELTLSYARELGSDLHLQTSLGAEYSRITQSGDVGLTRSFVRPKGFVALDWDANDNLTVSTRLERVVGQLSFSDFVASINVNEGQVDVSNVNLVPPQSWLLEVEVNQSLGDFGSITVRGSAEDFEDIVDQIPIVGGGQAPGNIDSAQRFGVSADLTLLSDPIGWPGARLDLAIALVESEVLDPLLGTPRQISDTETFSLNVDFRQDFPGSDWAAGFDFFYDEESADVRLDETSVGRESFAFASIFVEHKDVFDLTVRTSVSNVLDRDNDTFRTIFNDRLTNDVAFRQNRFRNFGTIFTLTVEGSF